MATDDTLDVYCCGIYTYMHTHMLWMLIYDICSCIYGFQMSFSP
jgi:hypothetical protein